MRIVGLGASAGGLQALERFFQNMPCDTGMSFLVVQHLDPTQKALLPELLQRCTRMTVRQAEQNELIRADTVYVIPPNRELRVHNGTLKLTPPVEPRGLRLPVNVLFSSLASDQSERAIAVLLSGMGSDGTHGLQAIKAVGGLTVVQAPDTAEFDAMPRSAIDADCADIVAPVDQLPARILAYVRQTPAPVSSTPDLLVSLSPVLQLLHQQTGHDFSLYKSSTLHRRIGRRMAIHGVSDLADYVDVLTANAQEVKILFWELLIGVTEFFRDPEVWAYLANVALPELLERQAQGHTLRVWVVGCSTGEEAYSLAMVLTEALERLGIERDLKVQIFASDISPDAIAAARRGQYPLTIESSVSEARLNRFFMKTGTHYQVNPVLRDKVLFAQHDVILDPPFTRLDLIACRNLLIYFDPVLQRRIVPMFHYSLRPDGLLMLGSAETVGRLNHLFSPMAPKMRIYQRRPNESIGNTNFLLKWFPPLSDLSKEQTVSSPKSPSSESCESLQSAADHVLLQVYAPAAVVLNADADIVYVSGRTGKYLEPAAGKANWNIYAMARDGLREPLYTAMQQVTCSEDPVELRGLTLESGADSHRVDVTLQGFHEAGPLQNMTMVIFRDASPQSIPGSHPADSIEDPEVSSRVEQYQQEIERLRAEAWRSREELQASNEEHQSMNEELQSANEELTTSKEEMQSMNEELQTINTEMQNELDDLALAQSDMQNVLNSIEIAVLFLDQDMNVRRYTERASAIISLRESDVGRPLSDLTSSLDYPELENDARETLQTLVASEKQVTTRDGHWFSARIIPYRRLDNVIDGVVITLVDITETKVLESSLRQQS